MRDVARVALFDGPGRPFRLVDLPLRALRDAEILVRVNCCTICGSDLHTVAGRRSEPTPCILGHEIVGRIERFGPDVPRLDLRGTPLTEGDRITWTSCASCGECFYCRNELPQKCDRIFKYGHQSIESINPLSGGLADFCVLLPGTGIVKLAAEMPEETACPANCATATIAATLRIAGGCHGKSVLIQGAGMLGLTACAMARTAGASAVICTDINDDRLDMAKRFGANQVVQASEERLKEIVLEVTAGRDVDLALELSGSTQAMETGLEVLRIGGSAVWVGAVYPTPAISIKPEMFVKRWITLHGVHNYAPVDLLAAIDFLALNQKRYPLAELVARQYSLAEIDRAFHDAQTSGAVRIAVRPGE